jgi:hypothetical protein
MSRSSVETTVLNTVASLDRALHPEVRQSVRQRWEAMLRECDYLGRKKNERLQLIRSKGWTPEKFGVLCWLNSFYQLFIGPLEASTRHSTLELGVTIPVAHGTERFDSARRDRTKAAALAFHNVVAELQLQRDWLLKNKARDLVYFIARYEAERDSLFEQEPAND